MIADSLNSRRSFCGESQTDRSSSFVLFCAVFFLFFSFRFPKIGRIFTLGIDHF